ncbi:hypothetical protein PC110_g13336 [Phytophthora cactorum]|uniref:Uncharacterized protein n=1 Tax=Phytophthora cactorum TaxID=29920 RepID=A0A329S0T6_9STRA|nr:hypothetical protein PC110_g13336 [Phytophthora cactorum]
MERAATIVDGADTAVEAVVALVVAATAVLVDTGPFTWITILSTSRGDVQERVTQPDTTPAMTDSRPVLPVLCLGFPMAKQ